jgi:hypothetical protein
MEQFEDEAEMMVEEQLQGTEPGGWTRVGVACRDVWRCARERVCVRERGGSVGM